MHKGVKWMAVMLVVLGTLLAWLAFMVQRKPQASVAAAPVVSSKPVLHILTARQAIPAGHVLATEDVQLQQVETAAADALVNAWDAVGRAVAKPLRAGESITVDALLGGISGMLRSGERAVAIKVDESTAVGNKVQPGDWVDLMVVFRKDGQEVFDTQVRRLLERKRVLAYGALTEIPQMAVVETAVTPKNVSNRTDIAMQSLRNVQQARTAVLAVQMDEVNALLLAERHGQLMLALRSPLDGVGEPVSMPRTSGGGAVRGIPQVVTLAQLTEHPVQAVADKPPPVLHPIAAPVRPSVVRPVAPQATKNHVELIRGMRSETIHY